MLVHRLKILLSIIISLVVVQGITYFSENPLPSTGQISKLFTFNLNPFKSGSQTGFINTGNGSFEFETISITPTDLPEAPDETITNQPTSPIKKAPTPTTKKSVNPTSTPSPKPTKTPKPTATPTKKKAVTPFSPPSPKTTKTPKPAATQNPAPVTADARPGTTMEEIFQ